MPLNLFYTMVQKSQKWPKTQIKGGGSCLKAGIQIFVYVFPIHLNLFIFGPQKNKFWASWGHKESFLKIWGKSNKKPIF